MAHEKCPRGWPEPVGGEFSRQSKCTTLGAARQPALQLHERARHGHSVHLCLNATASKNYSGTSKCQTLRRAARRDRDGHLLQGESK